MSPGEIWLHKEDVENVAALSYLYIKKKKKKLHEFAQFTGMERKQSDQAASVEIPD